MGWIILLLVYLAIITYGVVAVYQMHRYFKDLDKENNN